MPTDNRIEIKVRISYSCPVPGTYYGNLNIHLGFYISLFFYDKDSKELKNNFSEFLSVIPMLKFYGRATRYIMAEFFSGRGIQYVSRMTLQQQQKNTMPFPREHHRVMILSDFMYTWSEAGVGHRSYLKHS